MDSHFYTDAAFERASISRVMSMMGSCGMHGTCKTDERSEQLAGSDIRALDSLDREHVIDVKSIASDLPTFCQELGNCHSGRVGWIATDKKTTDYLYAYHTVEGCRSYFEGKRKMAQGCAHVLRDELILVSRSALIGSLENQLGIVLNEETARRLMKEAEASHDVEHEKGTAYFNIRNGHLVEAKKWNHDRVYVTLSMSMREKPLNIVVPKSYLSALSSTHVLSGDDNYCKYA